MSGPPCGGCPIGGTMAQPPFQDVGASASEWLQVMAMQRNLTRWRYDLLPVWGEYKVVATDCALAALPRETGKRTHPVSRPLADYRLFWRSACGYVTGAIEVLRPGFVLSCVYGLNCRG